MILHTVLWKLRPSITEEEKAQIRKNAKEHLEALVGVVPSLLSCRVEIAVTEGSGADMMLQASYADEAGLAAYQAHPAHQQVANTYVRPFVAERLCADCVID